MIEILEGFVGGFFHQIQSATLGFLIIGMLFAHFGAKTELPDVAYKLVLFMLLMRIGLDAGMEIRDGGIEGLFAMSIVALFSVILGLAIVTLGVFTFAQMPGLKKDDACATIGLFGAVSSATMVAGFAALDEIGVTYEGWIAALCTFMEVPALVLAIVCANMFITKGDAKSSVTKILKETVQGFSLSTLFLAILAGIFLRVDRVFEELFNPAFRGVLSILMLILGMECYKHLKELRGVAHWYAAYAFIAPIIHGLMGFVLGYVAHLLVGFSPGGVVMLAIIAASNSDISGPPVLRAGIPTANPSAYIGTSTGLGTPVAITICIPLFIALGRMVFGF